MLKREDFNKLFPKAKNGVYESIVKYQEKFNLPDLNYFLANVGIESGGFSVFLENLNYSSTRLKQIFPKYFKDVDPALYTNKPEKIANRVYANRIGNGNEASGEGWKFRGRGLIQITGKSNYISMSKQMELDLVNNPELLEQMDYAVESAFLWWQKNVLGKYKTIEGARKIVNGGTNGLTEVTNLFNKLKILNG